MFIEPASIEEVYHISREEQRKILHDHFNLFYNILGEAQLTPDAAFEDKGGVQRCLSGIPMPYYNAVIGYPQEELWNECINEQLHYFNNEKMPFVWYLDEESNNAFKEKLLALGFQDGGIFRGVLGTLDHPIPSPEIPDGCTLEPVQSEAVMEEFNELVCNIFGIQGISKNLYKKVLWECMHNESHPMFHWLARKDGKAVSAISTLIERNVVSFWNGASLPEMRGQGLNTALCRLALQDAIAKGCRIGVSYLMAEGLALGICTKLGAETKWRFNVFLAPN